MKIIEIIIIMIGGVAGRRRCCRDYAPVRASKRRQATIMRRFWPESAWLNRSWRTIVTFSNASSSSKRQTGSLSATAPFYWARRKAKRMRPKCSTTSASNNTITGALFVCQGFCFFLYLTWQEAQPIASSGEKFFEIVSDGKSDKRLEGRLAWCGAKFTKVRSARRGGGGEIWRRRRSRFDEALRL